MTATRSLRLSVPWDPLPRSAFGAGIASYATGFAILWTWAIVTPAWSTTITYDIGDLWGARTSPDHGTVLFPVGVMLFGMALGGLGWILLAERRLPDRPRWGRRSWSEAMPSAMACLLFPILARIVLGSTSAYRHASEGQWNQADDLTGIIVTESFTPTQAALDVSMAFILWGLIYGVARGFALLAADESGGEPTHAPDPAWEARRLAAAAGLQERALFRYQDHPDALVPPATGHAVELPVVAERPEPPSVPRMAEARYYAGRDEAAVLEQSRRGAQVRAEGGALVTEAVWMDDEHRTLAVAFGGPSLTYQRRWPTLPDVAAELFEVDLLHRVAVGSAALGVPRAAAGDDDRPTRLCPECAERIFAAARICRYCRQRIDPPPE